MGEVGAWLIVDCCLHPIGSLASTDWVQIKKDKCLVGKYDQSQQFFQILK